MEVNITAGLTSSYQLFQITGIAPVGANVRPVDRAKRQRRRIHFR
ncbi:MAG: hypothetical protein R3C45_04860 [Phycisphaerales bacterium]